MSITHHACRRAATLRDTIIAVAVAVALALLGTLYLTRGTVQAGEAQSLSNLRQIGEAFASYAAFQEGRMPYAAPGDPLPLGPRSDSPETSVGEDGRPVWMLETMWFAIVPVGDTWAQGAEVARSPGADPMRFPLDPHPDAWGTPASVGYHYSNSFLADPRAWPGPEPAGKDAVEPAPEGAPLIRATFAGEVAFPSRKVLLYDAHRAYLAGDSTPETARPLLFVDNSAFGRLDADASRPVECLAARGEGRWAWPTVRVHHDTGLGVLGREY